MKLKKIDKLCKEAGFVRLFDDFTMEGDEDGEFRFPAEKGSTVGRNPNQ